MLNFFLGGFLYLRKFLNKIVNSFTGFRGYYCICPWNMETTDSSFLCFVHVFNGETSLCFAQAAHNSVTVGWALLAKELPGRIDSQVMTRYRRLMEWKKKSDWFMKQSVRRASVDIYLSLLWFH